MKARGVGQRRITATFLHETGPELLDSRASPWPAMPVIQTGTGPAGRGKTAPLLRDHHRARVRMVSRPDRPRRPSPSEGAGRRAGLQTGGIVLSTMLIPSMRLFGF